MARLTAAMNERECPSTIIYPPTSVCFAPTGPGRFDCCSRPWVHTQTLSARPDVAACRSLSGLHMTTIGRLMPLHNAGYPPSWRPLPFHPFSALQRAVARATMQL